MSDPTGSAPRAEIAKLLNKLVLLSLAKADCNVTQHEDRITDADLEAIEARVLSCHDSALAALHEELARVTEAHARCVPLRAELTTYAEQMVAEVARLTQERDASQAQTLAQVRQWIEQFRDDEISPADYEGRDALNELLAALSADPPVRP